MKNLIKERLHLNTYTKTRVLAYLRQICLLLAKKELSLNILKCKLENFSDENLHYLEEYHKELGNPRGVITPKTKSAYRYILLAENMKLIFRRGERCKLTKYGKILANLAKKEGNPFELGWKETCFFLKHLLEFDTLYFVPFLFSLSKYQNLTQLSSSFKKEVLSHLKKWFQITSDEYIRRRIMSIEEWRKEKKYVENLVPPRLYWCFDLKLLNLKDTGRITYRTTQAYNKLIRKLSLHEPSSNFKKWINTNFFSTFFEAYKSVFNAIPKKAKSFNRMSFYKQKSLILPKLEEMFQQEEEYPIPSKVLFSYFSVIICIKSLKEGILCEVDHLKDFLHDLRREEKYFLYWDPEMDDGFIRKL